MRRLDRGDAAAAPFGSRRVRVRLPAVLGRGRGVRILALYALKTGSVSCAHEISECRPPFLNFQFRRKSRKASSVTTHPTPKSSDRSVEDRHLAASIPERAELVELALDAVEDPSVMFDLLDVLDVPQMRALVMRLAQVVGLIAIAPAGVDPAWFVTRMQLATATPRDPAGGAA